MATNDQRAFLRSLERSVTPVRSFRSRGKPNMGGGLSVRVSRAAGQGDPVNAGPVNFTVTFSKAATGFTNADVSFAGSSVGGTLAAAVTGTGPYNVAVTGMTGTGTVQVSIPAGSATDATGASFPKSNAATVSFDVTNLMLPLLAWEGGSAYWAQFPKAYAAGWADPAFFPISVFLGKSDSGHPASLQALGINVYCSAEHQTPISQVTDTGMFVLAANTISLPGEWTTAEIGNNPKVVGWFVADECEMGLSGCTLPTEGENLALFQGWCVSLRALNDGRFLFANWGNGVLGTFWSPNTMDDHVAAVDGGGVDKYVYTSGQVRFEVGRAPNWNAEGGTEANALSCSAYGWMARQMKKVFTTPTTQKPFWTVVETKMPFLGGGDTARSIITYAQIEAAVFSAIANEARGIIYFQHNGFYNEGTPPAIDPNTGLAPTTETYSLVNGGTGLRTAVQTINSKVTALAPVINTQTHIWNFGATGIDTMLKRSGNFIYIFASVGVAATLGSKTFTLPSAVKGTTADVLNESRTVTITAGAFSDTFATEATHHIYKISIT